MHDPRIEQARDDHYVAGSLGRAARDRRLRRDELVRALYAEGGWTQAALAAAISSTDPDEKPVSPELIAAIVQGRTAPGARSRARRTPTPHPRRESA